MALDYQLHTSDFEFVFLLFAPFKTNLLPSCRSMSAGVRRHLLGPEATIPAGGAHVVQPAEPPLHLHAQGNQRPAGVRLKQK